MKTHSSMLHVRMETDMKRKATAALAAMGMTASEAVRLFFHRIAVDQAFPLELKVPNAETQRAMAESEEMMRQGTARPTRTRSSKKAAASKRTRPPPVDFTRAFLRDWDVCPVRDDMTPPYSPKPGGRGDVRRQVF